MKKVIMYGSSICGDCVNSKVILERESNIQLEYRDITESTSILKEFLAYRDHEPMFQSIREQGKIGIPFFILEDGTKTLDLETFVEVDSTNDMISSTSCSIDGKGNC